MKRLICTILLAGMILVQGCHTGCWVSPKNKTYEKAIKDYRRCTTSTENSYHEPFGVLIYTGFG